VQFEVRKGAARDIDLDIFDTLRGTTIYSTAKKSMGRAVFKTENNGTYRICFGNRFSTITEKIVVLTIGCGQLTPKENLELAITSEGLRTFVDDLLLLSDGMRAISEEQQYLKSRTIAHDEMAASTNSRVAYWSLFEAAMVCSVSAFQVYWLRSIFEQRRAA